MSSHPSPYSALGNEICALVDAGALEPVAAWFAAHPTCVNAHNARYQSPLMVAAQAPLSLPVLRHLLSIGASPHYTVGSELGMTALHLAAGASNVHGVALLLAAGADPLRLDSVGRSPLHCAAIAGSNAIVRRLLRAILHRVTVVALAWDERGGLGAGPPGHPGMGLSGSGVGEWPPAGSSSSSSSSSSIGSTATAATAPSAPAAPGPSAAALMSSLTVISRSIAASGESLESVLSALAAGGALAPAGSAPSAFTVAGARAPASGASSSSSSSAAALAAAARLPPTPAQRAQAMADLRVAVAESVTAFLNGQDDSGYTSLMLAAEHGREDVVKTLLAAGCDVLARNKLCHTAIGLADWFGFKSIVAVLEASLPAGTRATLSGGGGGGAAAASSSASASAAPASAPVAAASAAPSDPAQAASSSASFSAPASMRAHPSSGSSIGSASAAAAAAGGSASSSASSKAAAAAPSRSSGAPPQSAAAAPAKR